MCANIENVPDYWLDIRMNLKLKVASKILDADVQEIFHKTETGLNPGTTEVKKSSEANCQSSPDFNEFNILHAEKSGAQEFHLYAELSS